MSKLSGLVAHSAKKLFCNQTNILFNTVTSKSAIEKLSNEQTSAIYAIFSSRFDIFAHFENGVEFVFNYS